MKDDQKQNEQPSIEKNDIEVDDQNGHLDDPVPTGRRLSLSKVRRQLTDEELSSPGIQKLLLDILEEAENERDNLKNYVSSYYEADKKAAVLGEKLVKDKKIDVFFGVGVGLGGAILGLIPFLGKDEPLYGLICGIIGLALIIGSSIGRLIIK